MPEYSLVAIDTLSRRKTLSNYPRVLYHPRKAVTLAQLLDLAGAKWARNEGIHSKVYFELLDEPTITLSGKMEVGLALGRIRSVPKIRNGMARDLSGVVEIRFTEKLNI